MIDMKYKVAQCATGVSKGGVLGARERDSQRPFGRLLLVLFLPVQEKYSSPSPLVQNTLSAPSGRMFFVEKHFFLYKC